MPVPPSHARVHFGAGPPTRFPLSGTCMHAPVFSRFIGDGAPALWLRARALLVSAFFVKYTPVKKKLLTLFPRGFASSILRQKWRFSPKMTVFPSAAAEIILQCRWVAERRRRCQRENAVGRNGDGISASRQSPRPVSPGPRTSTKGHGRRGLPPLLFARLSRMLETIETERLPHDASYKEFFSDPDMVRSLLKRFIAPWQAVARGRKQRRSLAAPHNAWLLARDETLFPEKL